MSRTAWVWNEACPYCKGYPEYPKCDCTWQYKMKRLRLRWYRFVHRKKIAEQTKGLF